MNGPANAAGRKEPKMNASSEAAACDGDAGISVFLLDDHEVVRRGLRDLLNAEPGIDVIGEAGTMASAVARVTALRPDVAVLDVRLPDGDGVSACREIRSRLPGTACLMLTSYGDEQALLGAIMAGAAGYVMKQACGAELVSAVRTVAAGESILDPQATRHLMARLRDRKADSDPLSALSTQEKRVLELIGEGLTNRQIAERMFLAEKTVGNYVSALLAKLGMHRRTQAAALSVRLAAHQPDLTRRGTKSRYSAISFVLFFRVAQVRQWLAESAISDPADGPEAGLAKEYSYLSPALFSWP